MNELLHFFGVAGFGSACTALGFVLGRRHDQPHRHREEARADHPAVDAVIAARARQVTAERGVPEAAGMVTDLASAGWRSAHGVVIHRPRGWRSWRRW